MVVNADAPLMDRRAVERLNLMILCCCLDCFDGLF